MQESIDFVQMGVSGEGHLHLPPTRLLLVPFLSGKEKEQHPREESFSNEPVFPGHRGAGPYG